LGSSPFILRARVRRRSARRNAGKSRRRRKGKGREKRGEVASALIFRSDPTPRDLIPYTYFNVRPWQSSLAYRQGGKGGEKKKKKKEKRRMKRKNHVFMADGVIFDGVLFQKYGGTSFGSIEADQKKGRERVGESFGRRGFPLLPSRPTGCSTRRTN